MAVLAFRCQSLHIMPVAIKAFIFHLAQGPITPAVYLLARRGNSGSWTNLVNNMLTTSRLSGFNMRCQLGLAGV